MSVPSEFAKEAASCHYCGEFADPQIDYTSELTCSFKACGRRLYHQDCVETHLRRQKMQVGRMAGFGCPRGHHKNATDNDPCGGKISSSHRSHPVNLKKKAKALEPLPKPEFKPHVPKPKLQAAAAAAKPAAKVPHTQRGVAVPSNSYVNAPIPVKPLGRPHVPKVKNTGSDMSQDQMKAAVALIRQQLNVETTFNTVTSQLPPPVPATVKASQVPNPLLSASRPIVPNLKPDPEFLPSLKAAGPRDDLSWHEPRSINTNPITFSLTADAFPSLDGKPTPQPVEVTKPAVIEHSSIDQDSSWCTDVDHYNKLIGVSSSSDFDIDESGTTGNDNGSSYDVASDVDYQHSLSPSENIAPAAVAAVTQAHGLAALTDEMLAYVMQYGVEAAGLPAEYDDFLNELLAQAPTDSAVWNQETEEEVAYDDTEAEAEEQYAAPGYAVAGVHLHQNGQQDAYTDFYDQTQEFAKTAYRATTQDLYPEQTKVHEVQTRVFTTAQPIQYNLPVPLPIPVHMEAEVEEEEVNLDDLLALCIG